MLLLIAILFPIIAGIVVSVRKMDTPKRNRAYTQIMLATDFFCIVAMAGGRAITLFSFTENVPVLFSLDNFGRYFLAAVIILYTAVCFYAFEYMTMEEDQERFFMFFFISLGMLIATAMAGNLVTMYFCFEMVTLTTVPLVLHERSKEAIAAALKYLFYSIGGALLGLLAVFFVCYYSGGSPAFVLGGTLTDAAAGNKSVMLLVIMCGIIGFGTKAGMYPMHGWLPSAHPIAPAPASALLSGIVAKAGVLAIIRLIYYSVGTSFLQGTWVQYTWMCLAMLTIFMGSMMAFREKVIKKRLAYSTVSQISYILLGLSFLSDQGLRGGLLHLMSHAASKGCLFLCAGVFIYRLGYHNVDELKGIAKRMPITMWCFTFASLSLVGIPPMGGFLSKWVIASAAINSGLKPYSVLAPAILLLSALLTAGYLLTVVVNAFFPGRDVEISAESAEPSKLMTIPMICLCCVSLVMGIFGTSILSAIGL